MKKYCCFVPLLLICFIVSCSTAHNTTLLKNRKPYWYWKPNVEEKIGGVGIAGRHIRGLNEQRNLAIQRCIDIIARQVGVKVSNVSKTTLFGNQDSVKTMMECYSIQTVDGEIVKAIIKEFWEDPETNELYVWMVVQ